ncbi:hypothetical protein [Flagellimonas sp. CMM7]|uniref:hypothetical protein n=1 Tax=Flagellimonas sp. CMM7 TaxID=2654676 RepID=UPI001969CB99|nr:hypothetical protein [Flagellimonas sp. CMM7]UII78480.1 hypothetical protein LV704_12495 [Flagellimonas sp. CMM7]
MDGYIADKNGGVDWLESTPNPNKSDLSYNTFIEQIGAMVIIVEKNNRTLTMFV